MDKVKNISLGGFSFIIEETAYNALNNYLNEVRNHLNQNTDREEILYDVEQRMAELLKVRLKEREVVIGQDVQYLIEVLGRPEQYVESEEPLKSSQTLWNQNLYRDTDDKKLGGVLSGLAHYFKVDVTKMRIAFALLFLLFLLGGNFYKHFFFTMPSTLILLYAVFWAVVPPARTTVEKLEMKGEAVTLDTLSNYKSVTTTQSEWKRSITDKKLLGVLGGLAQYSTTSSTWLRIAYLALLLLSIPLFKGRLTVMLVIAYLALGIILKKESVFEISEQAPTFQPPKKSNLGNLILSILLYFILAVILLPLFVAVMAVLLGVFGVTVVSGFSAFLVTDYLPFIFEHQWQVAVLYLSLILLFLLPVSVVVLISLKLFIKSFRSPKIWVIANVLALVIGLIGLLTVGGTLGKEFITKTRVEEKIPFTTPSDTLVVEKIRKEYGFNSPIIPINTDTLMVRDCSFFIDTLPQGAVPYLQYIRTARGSNTVEAKKNAQSPIYPLTIKGNHISFPYYYQIAKGNVYRGQEVKIKLFVPIGTYVRTLNETFFSQKGGRWLNENGLYKVSKDSIYEVTAK